MSTTPLNPFPDYAVTRLVAGSESDGTTVPTGPILQARALVADYCGGLEGERSKTRTNAVLCAVRGDYGTGKTHLLNDAAAHLQMFTQDASAAIVRSTCIETDTLAWYRATLGPELDGAWLTEAITLLYARAAQTIARTMGLTSSASDYLEQKPLEVRRLIQEDRLSVDEVTREFEKLLSEICADYEPVTRKVLSRLMWPQTSDPARAWIKGATISERDAELLGLPRSIGTPDLAASTIGSIAAVLRYIRHPFVILVDELEHFTRYDSSHKSFGNITWLKRLLEILGQSGALVLVAGHWDAWETTKDYLDRFPQHPPVDLLKLSSSDVLMLLKTRLLPMPPDLTPVHATVIADVTGGNMRRIMSLCNLLYRTTNGFASIPTEKQIRQAGGALARRVPIEQAVVRVTGMLEQRGYRVESEVELGSARFDIVARRADGRVIALDVLHITVQQEHYDTARRFIDKMHTLGNVDRGAVGFYLVDGSIDDELLGILRGSRFANMRWFDLTSRDVLERIEAEIAALEVAPVVAKSLLAPSGAVTGNAPAVQVHVASANSGLAEDVEKRLRELDDRRSAEQRALLARVEDLARQLNSPRAQAVVNSEPALDPERARAAYESLMVRPPIPTKLRSLGSAWIIGAMPTFFGLFLLLGAWNLPVILAHNQTSFELIRTTYWACSIALILGGLAVLLSRYFRVVEYFDFAQGVIRDLYLRNVNVQDLVAVDKVFRGALQDNPIYVARNAAIKQLKTMRSVSQSVVNYAKDLGEDDGYSQAR
jgi:hypothetical protein